MILKQPPNVSSVGLSDFLRAMQQNMDQVSERLMRRPSFNASAPVPEGTSAVADVV